MRFKSRLNEKETIQTLRARLNMGIMLLVFWLLLLFQAYLTFPFVEHTSSIQNVIYGVIIGLPFLILVLTYIHRARKDLVSFSKK